MAALLVIAMIPVAHAQTVVVPRAAEADAITKQAMPQPQPEAPLEIKPAPSLVMPVPEGADKQFFQLNDVVITGNTTYHNDQIERLYGAMLGKQVSIADMYQVAGHIAQLYHNDGYVLATAYLPPQKFNEGIVHISVIEGYVAHVTWSGEPLDSGIARDLADRLTAMHPLDGKVLEEVMLRLNDLPSVSAQATIAPYKGNDATDGAVDVTIAVERKHFNVQAGVNDYVSRYLGVWQDVVQGDVGGFFSSVDRVSISEANSLDPHFFQYTRGEYSLPVTDSGLVLKAGTSYSHSAPGYILDDLDIRSNALSNWVGITQTLIRSRLQNLSVASQFGLDSQTTDVLGTRFYNDRLRTLKSSGTYSFSDEWAGSNLFNLEMTQGLNILGETKTGSTDLSNPNGHSDFMKWTLNASRLQDVGYGFSVLAAFAGQESDAPLLSLEQFGYGGMEFGRAYDPSEISGDDGMAFSAELRYQNIYLSKDVGLAPFAFYDVGRIWTLGPDATSISGASAGGGFRMTAWDHVQTELTLAQPLTLAPAAPKLGETGKDMRLGLSIKLVY